MNKRLKLFKVAIANRSSEAWPAYKRASNNVTTALKNAKASYFTKMFGEVKNSTSYWNLVNRATQPEKPEDNRSDKTERRYTSATR